MEKLDLIKNENKKIKVMFVCLGNICRSPMAEFVFKHKIKERGLSDIFEVSSSATSYEEFGNGVHYGTLNKLKKVGIDTYTRCSTPLNRDDLLKYDIFVGMEQRNLSAMRRILGNGSDGKIARLLDFSDNPRDIADPWYTGNFDETYEDVVEGCDCLIDYLMEIK